MFSQIKDILRPFYYLFQSKHGAELRYWKRCFRREGGTFSHGRYKTLMLGMAGEADDCFLQDKTVADFGCGPRGSLMWAHKAKERIGIDVLASIYCKHFAQELSSHKMNYITCTEVNIPLADDSIDVLFTLNALDHVENLEAMCQELRRIIKPGGLLIGSFNLNHRPTKAEPQVLTEDKLRSLLFKDFDILTWKCTLHDNSQHIYQPLLEDKPIPSGDKPAILWSKGRKKL